MGQRLWVGGLPTINQTSGGLFPVYSGDHPADLEQMRMLALGELEPGAENCASSVNDIAERIGKISDDAGWKGSAADGFKLHFERTVVAVKVMAATCLAATAVLKTLIAELTGEEEILRRAAGRASANGVPIDPSTGMAPLRWEAPDDHAASEYLLYWQRWGDVWQAVAQTRKTAYEAMLGVLRQLWAILTGEGDQAQLSNADWATIYSYLRGVISIPASIRSDIGARIHEAQGAYDVAHGDWMLMRDMLAKSGQKMPAEVKAARSQALRELNDLKSDLGGAWKWSVAEALNLSAAETIGRLGPRAAAIVSDVSDASKVVKVIGDTAVLDWGLAAYVTYEQAQEDIEKGVSPWRAYAQDGTANTVGLLAGAGVTAAIIGIPAEASAAVVGGAVAVGGLVTYGVGDAVYQGFHEHWDEDIQQYGVISGVGTGIGNTISRTGTDIANMGKGIWNFFGGHAEKD